MFVYLTVSVFIIIKVREVQMVAIDETNCGTDSELSVHKGIIDDIKIYPWYGIFYYKYEGGDSELRVVTPVILIQDEFVLANAIDIGPIPKENIRSHSRVLLGEHWIAQGRAVRNYVLHPEYENHHYNTIALIQLAEGVSRKNVLQIKPICPPPNTLMVDPELYVIKFTHNFEVLHREMIEATHVPERMCRDFYIAAELYMKSMRPANVVCAVSLEDDKICVWNSGALVKRDVWGRWQLLGMGVRGPGCNAPARFLDMLSYYPWITESLDKFRRITITKINNQKYVLRSAASLDIERRGGAQKPIESKVVDGVMVNTQRFGNCDEEEKQNLLYRDSAAIGADSEVVMFASYNMTIRQSIEITCMTLEIVNGSGISEMSVRHFCTRAANSGPCYEYKGSLFDVSVMMMFVGKIVFEMAVWGFEKHMKLLDVMEWRWEEGSFYDDFRAMREEYRGPPPMTDFGYEPLDSSLWMPNYDLWTTSTAQTTTDPDENPPTLEDKKYKFTTIAKYLRTTSRRPTGSRFHTTTTEKKKTR